MLGKKILASVFAGLILIKLAFLLASPEKWLGATQAFFGHSGIVMAIYLVLLVITGYLIFTTLDLIDVAVVMLFTAALVGISLIPYADSLQKMGQEIGSVGLGKAWLAWVIWVVIAVAVFSGVCEKGKIERGAAQALLGQLRC
ncbi:MAG: hypothetical protein WC600_06390 [Desulfobaccales bacterium]